MKRGFEEVAKIKTEVDAQRAIFDMGYVPTMQIVDGETVSGLWFNGTDDEPGIIETHTRKLGPKKFRSTLHREGQCVACYLLGTGDSSISKPQKRGVFLVADPRMIHKIKDEEKSSGDRIRYKFEKCTGDGKCRLCKLGHKAEPSGQKKLELSMTWVFSLMGLNKKLQGKCVCGGTIKTTEKPDGTVVATDCSKCKDPSPLNMFMVPWDITRSGSDKSTSYNFIYTLGEDQPEWVMDLKVPNLDLLYREPTIAQQCKDLDVQNPFEAFAAPKETVSYEDSSEDPFA